MGSYKWYSNAFFNTFLAKNRSEAFDAIAVPESHKVSRRLVLDPFSNIDFKKDHAPVLFIGGGKDHP